ISSRSAGGGDGDCLARVGSAVGGEIPGDGARGRVPGTIADGGAHGEVDGDVQGQASGWGYGDGALIASGCQIGRVGDDGESSAAAGAGRGDGDGVGGLAVGARGQTDGGRGGAQDAGAPTAGAAAIVGHGD